MTAFVDAQVSSVLWLCIPKHTRPASVSEGGPVLQLWALADGLWSF